MSGEGPGAFRVNREDRFVRAVERDGAGEVHGEAVGAIDGEVAGAKPGEFDLEFTFDRVAEARGAYEAAGEIAGGGEVVVKVAGELRGEVGRNGAERVAAGVVEEAFRGDELVGHEADPLIPRWRGVVPRCGLRTVSVAVPTSQRRAGR